MQKRTLLTTALLSTAAFPAVSMADLSGNVGWVSDYIYRGVFQEDSSAYGGLDFETGGFYAGVWGADVGIGSEIDIYFGYGGSFGDSGGWSVGATGYFYTEDGDPSSAEPGFYDTITEINLGISFGMFALDHAIGEEDGWGFPTDYTFTTITVSPSVGPYYALNIWGDEYSGEYLEVGYGWELMDIDLNFAFLWAFDVDTDDPEYAVLLSEDVGYADTAITFGISKTFGFGD
jgi:uncharacterized protein (TIGR02001 family)